MNSIIKTCIQAIYELFGVFYHNAIAARPEWSSFVVFVAEKALAKLQKAGTEGGKAAQNNKNISRVHVILSFSNT